MAKWLRAEPAARFAEPVSVTGGQEASTGYRFMVIGRAGLRHADIVQAVIDWTRAQPVAYERRVIIRERRRSPAKAVAQFVRGAGLAVSTPTRMSRFPPVCEHPAQIEDGGEGA